MHEEILDRVNLKNSDIFISTVPDFEENISLTKKIKKENSKSVVIVVASRISEANDLYKVGADYVILPKLISGEKASDIVKKIRKDKNGLKRLRNDHKKYLNSIHRLLY